MAPRAGVAGIRGAVPHVLHHAGPFAGAALLGGATGTALFGLLGFAATLPPLLRARRRTVHGACRALLAMFAAAFAFSTLVLGPALTATDAGPTERVPLERPSEPQPGQTSGHEGHH